MESTSQRRMSAMPGILLSLFLLSLTTLAWPRLLETIVSLDWRIGDMRPVAHGLQVVFVCLFVISLLTRNRIASFYFKIFPTRRKLTFVIVAVSLSSILSVVAVEITCRFLGLPFEDKEHWVPGENALAQFDAELGWSYIPHRSVVQEFGTERRKVAMHFDEIGSRVRAPGVQHDPARPTVLSVGDSYAFGHGLPYEETFVGQLESMPEFPFQVVNLAVQGYGTDQALLLLKRHFKKFNTKAVVYTYIDELIARNANYDRRIMYRYIRILGTKPLFALRHNGTVYLKKKPVRYEHLRYSRLWASIQVVWSRWGPKPNVELTRGLVQEMKDYVASNGATFVVIHWYQRDHSKWNPPSTLGPGESPFGGMSLNLIDTTASQPPDWRNWLIQGDEHPDARAHAHVALLIVEEFQRILGNPNDHRRR